MCLIRLSLLKSVCLSARINTIIESTLSTDYKFTLSALIFPPPHSLSYILILSFLSSLILFFTCIFVIYFSLSFFSDHLWFSFYFTNWALWILPPQNGRPLSRSVKVPLVGYQTKYKAPVIVKLSTKTQTNICIVSTSGNNEAFLFKIERVGMRRWSQCC